MRAKEGDTVDSALARLKLWESRYNVESKTADNMRSLLLQATQHDLSSYLSDTRERLEQTGDPRLARMVLAVQAPLANRLNLTKLRQELEDTAFKIAYPKQHEMAVKLLRRNSAHYNKDLTRLKDMLAAALDKAGVKVKDISGRGKQPYSLYKKLSKTGTITDIHDLLALRILTGSEADCYQALDIVHVTLKPELGRYKDYIKQPKPNGYQSLHSTVYWGKKTVELQIRTVKMHIQAEGGVAAHWQYDQHKDSKHYSRGRAAKTVRPGANKATYVFSPLGDVYGLPAVATPLDFAFAVHTGVGLKTIGAKINGKMVKLNSKLAAGDVVEIVTGTAANPKRDWLQVVVSRKARHRIRTWLRSAERDRYHDLGRQMLIECFNGSLPPTLSDVLSRYNYDSIDDLLVAIGSGDIQAETIKRQLVSAPAAESPASPPIIGADRQRQQQVKVAGMSGLQYRLGSCCQPKPPVAISGYITRSLGITIHKKNCRELPDDAERLITCEWF